MLRRRLGEARSAAVRRRRSATTPGPSVTKHGAARAAAHRRCRRTPPPGAAGRGRVRAGLQPRTPAPTRDAATIRARLLLDTVIEAATGLRRELGLPAIDGAPGDVVEAGLPGGETTRRRARPPPPPAGTDAEHAPVQADDRRLQRHQGGWPSEPGSPAQPAGRCAGRRGGAGRGPRPPWFRRSGVHGAYGDAGAPRRPCGVQPRGRHRRRRDPAAGGGRAARAGGRRGDRDQEWPRRGTRTARGSFPGRAADRRSDLRAARDTPVARHAGGRCRWPLSPFRA